MSVSEGAAAADRDLAVGLTFRGPQRWRRCFDDVFGDLPAPPSQTLRLHRHGRRQMSVSLPGQRVTGTPGQCAAAVLAEHGRHVAAAAAARFAVLTGSAVAVGATGVALVAPPRAGATTLARALLATGAGYLSDAMVLVDSDTFTVHPLPFPFPATAPALPTRASTVASLASTVPLRALIFPQRQETPADPSCERLAPAAALTLLAACTAAATGHETEFFRRLTEIARRTPASVLRYHEAVTAVPLLRAELT